MILRQLVLGPGRTVGQRQGKRRCQIHRPQGGVFINTSFPSVGHDLHSRVASSTTGTGIAAGVTAGARRSRRLQGLPRAPTAGRARHVVSKPHITNEVFSSQPCVLRGLDDVASTPLCEPISSLHDDGLLFDRGK